MLSPASNQINPLQGISFSTSALTMGCLGALPIFLISVLLEKSGVEFFRKIDQDTKLYVVQVFGAERNWPVRIVCGRSLAVELIFEAPHCDPAVCIVIVPMTFFVLTPSLYLGTLEHLLKVKMSTCVQGAWPECDE